MLTALIGYAIKWLGSDLLSAIMGVIQTELNKRNYIAQGAAAQHTADLEETFKESTDAAQIRDQVASEPISAVDADLQRLHH